MVFLHPRILRDDKQSMALTSDKYNYMRAKQLDIRERGVSLMLDEVSPLLEEMKDFLELPPPYDGDAGLTPQESESDVGMSPPALPTQAQMIESGDAGIR